MSEPQWQTCPKCGERWWDSHVCRNTLNSLKVALAPTCQFCGQTTRAQPSQAGPLLSEDDMLRAIRPLCHDDSVARLLVENSGDEYRAIEAAVLAKRVPMTDEQVIAAFAREPIAMSRHDFTQGIRYAERHHGIVGEKGGA